MVDQAKSVEQRIAWKLCRDGDRVIEQLARRIDATAQRPTGELKLPEQPLVREIDGSLAIWRDPPQAWLVIRHQQVAGAVERQVVPHCGVPIASIEWRRRRGEHIKCGLFLADAESQNPAVHVGDEELVIAAFITIESKAPQSHGCVGHGRYVDRLEL